MEEQTLHVGTITLIWSDWYPWDELKKDARGNNGIAIPNKKPGVYEVKHQDSEKRLTIGKASDLRFRIRQGLIKGKSPHSAGKNIRKNEDTKNIVVRWAKTERRAAAEEELHNLYLMRYDILPKYTEHT